MSCSLLSRWTTSGHEFVSNSVITNSLTMVSSNFTKCVRGSLYGLLKITCTL